MDNNMMKSFDKNNNFNKADMMQPEFDINQHEDEQTVHIRR